MILIAAVMEEVMVREVRILMVVEAETFTVAVAEAMTLMVAFVGVVMVVTLLLETMKIIRAITRWYRCPEHHKTVKDQDAAYPSVSLKRDRGLVRRLTIEYQSFNILKRWYKI